jgi:hypothetical protein
MDPVTLFRDEVMSASVWNNLAIFECAGMWHALHVGEIARAYDVVFAKHAQGCGLTFVRPATPVPKASVLNETGKLMKQLGSKVAWSVVVVEERGPLAALTRSVIRGLNVLGASSRISAAATVDECPAILLPHLRSLDGLPITALDLLTAVRRSREKFNAAALRPH